MKIRLERSGGFAGISNTVEIDAESLSEDERLLMSRLVRDADFFALPASVLRPDPTGADRFHYRITIDSADGTHTVETNDASVPDSMGPLIDWLSSKLRTGRMDSVGPP